MGKASADEGRSATAVARLPPPSSEQVVFLRPYSFACARDGRPGLGVGFALRCFQRFSRPAMATRRGPWRDHRHTSGPSLPVLSY